MENQFQFKTNINCGGCIAAVKPFLDKTAGVDSWQVDTNNPDKILTVSSTEITVQEIISTVEQAGYKIEQIG